MVKAQAHTILEALLEADPVHCSVYETNYKKFVKTLITLDSELRKALKSKESGEFIVFHPSWGYFADTYGLRQIPVEVEGKDPKPARLKELIEHAKARGIKIIFVQPQFTTKSAETIARAINGKVVFADPLALDWAENLRKQAKAIKAAIN